MIAYQRVVDAFRDAGLIVIETGHGKANAQAPNHSPADRSVSIRDIGDQVLLHSHSDPTDQVMDALSLTMADLFDKPLATYEYPDGRIVSRSPSKKFRQAGNTKGTSLYRADRLAGADVVYMAEGEKDVHALESEGVAATCTAMGAGKAHLFDLTPLHGKKVRIIRDMDAPGRAHAAQLMELLSGKCDATVWEPAEGKDAADHIASGHTLEELRPAAGFDTEPLVKALEAALEAARSLPAAEAAAFAYRQLDEATAVSDATPRLRKFASILDDWWEWVDAPPTRVRTIPTPWPELDDLLAGGLQAGRSYLFAGRPGGGKSLALTNFAAYAAALGRPGALFSVEMGVMEIASRILAAGGRAEYGQVTGRRLDDYNRGKIAAYAVEVEDMPLWVSDQAPITIDQIRAQARALKRSNGLDFVAVDYVQLLRATDSRQPRERQIADISWGLKTLAKELDVAVVSACQLNRGPAKEKRPPTIAELRESGALEQDSDVVILLHHNLADGQPSGLVDLIVGKNRTGKLSTITLPWRGYQARLG
ncbi:DnaB-like helicase C-terminal domain-containing protein [Nocardia wallacei]|uniref:DnaB-like helicase C-terminal domain-containing protein n=1 Tax=Nocardia wallacei TaxID=480035 RepID=UPI002455F764|nr:DnaB-like helicase C-terminal domain-containing protein [Nocardia wallacei]